jgi:hypothetical protein
MRVSLKSVGNPDYRQDPDKPLYGVDFEGWIDCSSKEDASIKCQDYINRNELGGGNWAGGEIIEDNGVVIGKVAYNGRIFDK